MNVLCFLGWHVWAPFVRLEDGARRWAQALGELADADLCVCCGKQRWRR